MSAKQKRTFVTVQQRLLSPERINKGESVLSICTSLGISKSTVQ